MKHQPICDRCQSPLEFRLQRTIPGTSDPGIIITPCDCKSVEHMELIEIVGEVMCEVEEITAAVESYIDKEVFDTEAGKHITKKLDVLHADLKRIYMGEKE